MPKTALIADDSRTMRQMVADALTAAGFEVIAGKDGADALRQVAGRRVDLVVTDFNMPVMNGPALVRRLRAEPAYKFTPILVLTTETDEARKAEGRAAGATGWMTKPFDPARLAQVVARLVP